MHANQQRFRPIRVPEASITFSNSLPKLVMVVTCKGRLNHLKLTLPGLLFQLSLSDRLVVVDYGDPDGAFDYCRSLFDPRLVPMKVVDNTEPFNLSRARNCGANLLPSDVLVFVDADSILHPDFISQAVGLIRIGRAVLTRRELRDQRSDTCGLCCVRTDIFHEVRGYDEAFEGWGPEDADFYRRVATLGPVHNFPARLYPATVPHSDEDRTRFYDCKSRFESACRSGQRMTLVNRIVNENGYGRATAELLAVGITEVSKY
jgi:glycosyltransferase involved in cell wall biosynthesis